MPHLYSEHEASAYGLREEVDAAVHGESRRLNAGRNGQAAQRARRREVPKRAGAQLASGPRGCQGASIGPASC